MCGRGAFGRSTGWVGAAAKAADKTEASGQTARPMRSLCLSDDPALARASCGLSGLVASGRGMAGRAAPGLGTDDAIT
jgi:hypothetical protein